MGENISDLIENIEATIQLQNHKSNYVKTMFTQFRSMYNCFCYLRILCYKKILEFFYFFITKRKLLTKAQLIGFSVIITIMHPTQPNLTDKESIKISADTDGRTLIYLGIPYMELL